MWDVACVENDPGWVELEEDIDLISAGRIEVRLFVDSFIRLLSIQPLVEAIYYKRD